MKIKYWILLLPAAAMLFSAFKKPSPVEGPGRLKRIYFNLYTDSIKTVLNYYINIEGEYYNGRVLPLDTGRIAITADHGRMAGNEWIAPKLITFEQVTFHAVAKEDPAITSTITVWLKRAKDPRDDLNGTDEDIPVVPDEVRKRHR